MNKVHICESCGRTINSEYLYCPWCGESRLDPEDKESMNAVVQRLLEIQKEDKEKQLEAMKNKLDALDRELSNLALSVEMHR